MVADAPGGGDPAGSDGSDGVAWSPHRWPPGDLPATGAGGGGDTDAPNGDTLPTLTWTEMFTVSGLCAPPSCTTAWSDPNDVWHANPVTYVHVVAGGWRVAGPQDPWFTVLADVERDLDGDGTFETRGLVLAWDPATRALIDQPLLPDDFVSLGLMLPEDVHREMVGLSIVDVDDDGVSELAQTSRRGTPLLRFDAATARLEPVGTFLDEGLSDALAAGPTNLGLVDVDNDGLLDLEWPSMPYVTDSAVVTFVQAGRGTWEHQTLYTVADGWETGSGLGTLWSDAGGNQIRLMPGNAMGECFAQRLDGGVPVMNSDGYPLFAPCLISVPDAGPGMGVATVDLNGDGAPEIVSARDQARRLNIVEVRDVASAQIFNVASLYDAELPLAYDRPMPTVPWAVGPLDLNRDGWRDIVTASGEDYTFNAPCETQANCLRVQPIGVWINPGVPDGVERATAHPNLRNLPLDHVLGAVPPIGDFNGGLYVNVDGDGDADMLFSPVYGGEPRMFLDDTDGPNHGFCLRARGTTSNALGIGSVIEVETKDGAVQSFQLGGDGGPNVHTGQPEVCVGTGTFKEATVRWTWPSGTQQTLTHVPARRGGEPAAYVIEEPATLVMLDADGAPSTRRVLAGEAVTVQVCAFGDAPLRLGEPPARLPIAPTMVLFAEDLRGAASALSPIEDVAPPGCRAWTVTSSTPGTTRLSVTVDGVASRVHPRVWWDSN